MVLKPREAGGGKIDEGGKGWIRKKKRKDYVILWGCQKVA